LIWKCHFAVASQVPGPVDLGTRSAGAETAREILDSRVALRIFG
jgi:hypothetical protein